MPPLFCMLSEIGELYHSDDVKDDVKDGMDRERDLVCNEISRYKLSIARDLDQNTQICGYPNMDRTGEIKLTHDPPLRTNGASWRDEVSGLSLPELLSGEVETSYVTAARMQSYGAKAPGWHAWDHNGRIVLGPYGTMEECIQALVDAGYVLAPWQRR